MAKQSELLASSLQAELFELVASHCSAQTVAARPDGFHNHLVLDHLG
jgi:hypothetical protein